jgi:hypothetical protein
MIAACEDVATSAGGVLKLLSLRRPVMSRERSVLEEIGMRLTST